MSSATNQTTSGDAGAGKRDPLQVIESRKRKLAELYIVHHLDQIPFINNEDALLPLKENLASFLAKNDLEKGSRFTWDSLESSLTIAKPTPTSADISAVAKPDVEDIKEDSEPIVPKESTVPEIQTDENSNSNSSPVSPKPASEVSTSSTTEQTSQSQSQTQSQPQSTPSASLSHKSQSSQTSQLQPLSHNSDEVRLHSEPPRKKRKSPDSHISLYDPDNKDAIETVVLILKEFLPAKVAESTPLAELYYLAQTLPLVKLIPSTHKVVTSNMFESALTEGKINVVHSRIEELKRQGKWSLRQPTRFVDPIRSQYRTQWDNLLSEMNWMATDFKEERKLRVTSCAFIAQSVADYWKFGKVCCIKRKPIKYIVDDMSELIEFPKEEQEEDQALPETSMEKDDDSIDISKLLKRPNPEDEIIAPDLPEVSLEDYLDYKETQSPFKLSIDTNEMKPNDKSLIDNLPIFSSFQNFDDYYSSAPLIPVSKVVLPVEDENYYNVYFKNIIDDSNVIPDQQKGLFGFSSQKKISTSIKPPSPPNLKYLDLRTPTIWLPEDDQDLIEYVNQFSFNWGVVSAHLSKKPTRSYSSNIERRTPWQCFERYIQLNDTFQINDMRGSNTLNAMKWLEHAHNIQATTKRRISPLGVGVESIQRGHKRLRWASMFEAVRKCMRKRESITRPNTNQVRKPLDDKKLPAPTPAELSKLKYERDKAIQDAYLQNSAGFRGRPNPNVAGSRPVSGANPLPATQAQSQVQPTRPGQAPNGNPIAPSTNNVGTARIPQPTSGQAVGAVQQSQVQNNSISQSSPSLSPNVQRPNNVSVPGSTQQQPAINAQRVLNNNQAPKLTAPNGQPYTPEQLQQFVQMRQRKALQQQNAINGGSSVGNSNTSSPTMVNAQLNANNSLSSRSSSNPNATPSQNPSPVVAQNQIPMNKMNSPVNTGRNMAFVPAHVSAVISQIQAKNPNLSKAEVTKMAAQYLANLQAKQQSRNVQGNGFIEGVSSAGPVNQRSNSQQGASTSLQRPTNSAAASSPLQQQNSVSPALTPQQKAQLDMLKALHAEQQQKRQQSAKNSSSSSAGNGSGTGSPGNVVANNPSNKSNSSDGGD